MKNIKLLVEYDGTNYHGWQEQNSAGSQKSEVKSQKKIITIQGILQEKIKTLTGEDTRVISASRTDAGVHALGQIAAFRTDSHLEPRVIQRALNAMLPEDIRILNAEEAGEGFHPRYDAKDKTYFYLIANMDVTSAFIYRYAWRLVYALDLDAMKEVGGLLLGRHDFSAFRGSGCGSRTTAREIMSLDIERVDSIDFMTALFYGNFVKIRITANAFLRHMARNIVGTLVEVGRGKMPVCSVSEALESRDRVKAGPTAPANGLFLERIRY